MILDDLVSFFSEKWPSLFSHCHYYGLDLAALYPGPRWRARVAGIALSRVLPLSPIASPTLRYPFPLPPTAASATKLIVSPHFTPARRHAQPLLAALARSSRSLGGGRERGGGTGGLAIVLGEHSVTVHEPVPF